jgi:hypothetical protein
MSDTYTEHTIMFRSTLYEDIYAAHEPLLSEAWGRLVRHAMAIERYWQASGHRAPMWLTQLTARVSCNLNWHIGYHDGVIAAALCMMEERGPFPRRHENGGAERMRQAHNPGQDADA